MNEHAVKYAAALAAFDKAHWEFEEAVSGGEVSWPDVCAVFEASQDALMKSKQAHRLHNKTKPNRRKRRAKAEMEAAWAAKDVAECK